MKTQEKAIELVEKFKNRSIELGQSHSQLLAEANALIAVDEIIKETKLHDKTLYQHGRTFYWKEVKQEIEKL